ncbi:MAG: LacI family transcriptional regulator [Acidimicrobiaceae bacterium]|jgi:DNA-binding LacI/PurR family transcriptional regulator|nr:LacI family transcriptional regulator [Acidimicrobiaceae bacterium]
MDDSDGEPRSSLHATSDGSSPVAVRSPAMSDVAKMAGVSQKTVSRVLNDHPSVRPTTRMRVLSTIEALGYRPNLSARALATGRTRMLGLITLNTSLHGPTATLHGIDRIAREAEYFLSVASLRTNERHLVGEAFSRLAEQRVEGIIVIAALTHTPGFLSNLPTDMPVVIVGGRWDAVPAGVSVGVDEFSGARRATEHLLETGAETVFHLSGPADWVGARDRAAGWRAALTDAGLEQPPVLTGDWGARSGYEAGQILARIPDAHAIFAANDQMALGLLRALAEEGRKVPDDVRVAGFDDMPESAYFFPPLTTVHQDFDEVGRRSLSLLLDQLHSGRHEPTHVVIEPELVIRESTTHSPGRGSPLPATSSTRRP